MSRGVLFTWGSVVNLMNMPHLNKTFHAPQLSLDEGEFIAAIIIAVPKSRKKKIFTLETAQGIKIVGCPWWFIKESLGRFMREWRHLPMYSAKEEIVVMTIPRNCNTTSSVELEAIVNTDDIEEKSSDAGHSNQDEISREENNADEEENNQKGENATAFEGLNQAIAKYQGRAINTILSPARSILSPFSKATTYSSNFFEPSFTESSSSQRSVAPQHQMRSVISPTRVVLPPSSKCVDPTSAQASTPSTEIRGDVDPTSAQTSTPIAEIRGDASVQENARPYRWLVILIAAVLIYRIAGWRLLYILRKVYEIESVSYYQSMIMSVLNRWGRSGLQHACVFLHETCLIDILSREYPDIVEVITDSCSQIVFY